MGRGKIEIKRIENSSNRNVTYTKRRNGIIKKAKEITVLCDAKVVLIIFAPSTGKMTDFCSGPRETTLLQILDRYQSQTGNRLWDAKHENIANEINRVKKENDSMQVHLRHLNGEDITSLHHLELGDLEERLENGLTFIRDMKSEVMEIYRQNHRANEEDCERLTYELHKSTIKTGDDLRDMEYRHRMGNYSSSSHCPFNFRVHPIQPNLHDHDEMK